LLYLLSVQQLFQDLAVSTEINFVIDTDHRTADEPGLIEHQVNQPVVAEVRRDQSQGFNAGTARVEHLAGRTSLEQFNYLLTAELVLEKIPVCEFDFFLRKKLFRFPAGISTGPTIEIDFWGHFTPPLLFLVW
jgi:hypothetical protein